MQRAGCDQIIDLCSGAGGPLLQIQQILRDEDDFHVSVVMTDRFPNSDVIKRLQQTGVEDVTYLDASIDATSVPDHLKGLRTLFTSFHHLDPDLAIKVLQSAVEDQAAIAVFEFTERKFLKFIGALLSPIAVLFQTPRISPLSWGKLLWTYLLPVIPLMYLWDCAISHLRSYTVMELQELVLNVKAERYNWQVGIVVPEQTRDTITYLIGFPARSEEPTSACIF
ncbi:MAG TPA: hypothetical protein VJ810_22090 [Blastocatellia bacterium]|nr:hypothetical protein [Blastocatellia bacterium]